MYQRRWNVLGAFALCESGFCECGVSRPRLRNLTRHARVEFGVSPFDPHAEHAEFSREKRR